MSSDKSLEYLRRSFSRQIATRLRSERMKKGLNQRQLAQEVGLRQSVISYLESGKSNPTLASLVRLAQFFGLRVGDFFVSTDPSVRVMRAEDIDGERIFLKKDQIWERELAKVRQLRIRVRRGYIVVLPPNPVDYFEVRRGQVLVVPGGGKLKIFGMGRNPADFSVFESPRREGWLLHQ